MHLQQAPLMKAGLSETPNSSKFQALHPPPLGTHP